MTRLRSATPEPATDGAAAHRRRLLIVSAGFGAGHNVVAATVADAVSAIWPQIDVRVIDIVAQGPAIVARAVAAAYVLGVTRLPRIYGWCYDATNLRRSPELSLGEKFQPALRRPLLARTLAAARRFRPDLVLHTHWMAIGSFAEELARLGLRVPQAVIVTDVLPHRAWYLPGIDRYFVPAAESAAAIAGWRLDPSALTTGGFPVRAVWEDGLDLNRARKGWSIPDRPHVVLTGGAAFTCGPVVKLADQILARCPEVLLFVLCGRNTALQQELERLPAARDRLTAVPFSDRNYELIRSAAVFVTKAGGATVMECVAAGVPLVLLPPIPGQEAENAEWLSSHGAAVVAGAMQDVAGEVRRLLDRPSARDALSRNARALYRPGREAIIRYIGEQLGVEATGVALRESAAR